MGRMLGEVLTVEQFLRLPETKPALEFLGGRVVQKVSPKTSHSVIQTRLAARLLEYGLAHELGQPYSELRCTFGGNSFVFDIAYFVSGRIPKGARGRLVENVRVAPDLAVEIISPGQTLKEQSSKVARGVKNGVRLAWLIDPARDRVLIFRPNRATETLDEDGVLEGEDVLPGFALPVHEMFGWLAGD